MAKTILNHEYTAGKKTSGGDGLFLPTDRH
jgi:hypothetical protein